MSSLLRAPLWLVVVAACSGSSGATDGALGRAEGGAAPADDGSLRRADAGVPSCLVGCSRSPFELVDRDEALALPHADQAALTQTLTRYLTGLPKAAELVVALESRCGSPELLGHAEALARAGRTASCTELAERCTADGDTPAQLRAELAFIGGTCADTEGRNDVAAVLFRAATDPSTVTAPGFAGRVMGFARFLSTTEGPAAARELLARYPGWGVPAETVYRALEYLAGRMTLPESERGAAAAFVDAQLVGGDPRVRDQLFRLQAIYWADHEEWQRALLLIANNLDAIDPTTGWIGAAYNSLYRQGPSNFDLARELYRAYLPHAHPQAWVPTQFNTYDYSQLYRDACAGSLLQGQELARYHSFVSDWRSGAASTAATIARAQALLDQSGTRADLLTLLGSMHELAGDDDAARQAYWQAHGACPFYNRAHDGLYSVRRRTRSAQLPDRAQQLAQLARAVAATAFPGELASYVQNFSALPEEGQRRVRYALRYWAPWIARLSAGGYRLYLKQAFELVSDIPSLEGLRDQRVNTRGDYHLIDEDPGRSQGQLAVVDLSFVSEHLFGTPNAAAHELAHQFDAAAPQSLQACITTLYQRARSAGVFADAYAATSRGEYFAQGVTHYSVEAEAAATFGITRQWLAEHDVGLYSLLRTIGAAATPLEAIACPQ